MTRVDRRIPRTESTVSMQRLTFEMSALSNALTKWCQDAERIGLAMPTDVELMDLWAQPSELRSLVIVAEDCIARLETHLAGWSKAVARSNHAEPINPDDAGLLGQLARQRARQSRARRRSAHADNRAWLASIVHAQLP